MSQFKLSVGPWSLHTGADSYGPSTRTEPEEKVVRYDCAYADKLITQRRFEQHEMYTMKLLMGLV